MLDRRNIEKKDPRLPWVDKYRPCVLSEVIGHDDIKVVLKKSVELGTLPHLLFHGDAGTGKTSTILAIAMQLYGPSKFDQKVLELNASDENGINVVREKIINFAKIVVGSPDPAYPSPSFKMIILDEADSMTSEAQTALKKVMEVTCDITRFVFICNYENKIIEAIKSRCAIFRFKPIPKIIMMNRLKDIASIEHVVVDEKVLQTITDICNGDARRSIMTLQMLKYIQNGEPTTIHDIYLTVSHMEKSVLDKIWDKCTHCNISQLVGYAQTLENEGYPLNSILTCIKNKIIKTTDIDDFAKSLICIYIANVDRIIAYGSYNQLLGVMAFINGIYRKLDFVTPKIF